jgi:hypothetical protein
MFIRNILLFFAAIIILPFDYYLYTNHETATYSHHYNDMYDEYKYKNNTCILEREFFSYNFSYNITIFPQISGNITECHILKDFIGIILLYDLCIMLLFFYFVYLYCVIIDTSKESEKINFSNIHFNTYVNDDNILEYEKTPKKVTFQKMEIV